MTDSINNKKSKSKVSQIIAGPGRVAYVAYEESNKRVLRIKLRPKALMWERLSYWHLSRIMEDGIFGNLLMLVFNNAVVTIRGRNLQALADSVGEERCHLIQAFDAERWPMPTDEDAPFVEAMTVHFEKAKGSDTAFVMTDNPPEEKKLPKLEK